jgi:hypothetical protein
MDNLAYYIYLYEGGPSSVHIVATFTLIGTCDDNSMTFTPVPFSARTGQTKAGEVKAPRPGFYLAREA